MAELKTKPNAQSVTSFLNNVENPQKREDCHTIANLMEQVTGQPPVMWGESIVGFGHYHYRYESGREGDWFVIGFSPRKQNLTLYIMPGVEHSQELLNKLGKYKTGKACLYIKKLKDINLDILKQLLAKSVSMLP